jgi:hypothetical protein
MPYSVGSKGSYGCSGYPAVKDDGTVMGCHKTRRAAAAQIYAINRSEGNIDKSMHTLKEGDFVMGETTEGMVHGMVEHIMWEGGTLGTPGTEFALESTPPDNPAMSVRIYMEDENGWKSTAFSIGMMYQDAMRLESLEDHEMDKLDNIYKSDNEEEFFDEDLLKINLADIDLRPTEAMASNARRGLELRKKFGRGGTSVGVARARDLSNRKELSPETVARMYSFFSRHEVDKKGKDWDNAERPSNGKIAWLLWGGDSGYAWSKSKWAAIQRARENKNAMWKGVIIPSSKSDS